jgi:hypothetical protein
MVCGAHPTLFPVRDAHPTVAFLEGADADELHSIPNARAHASRGLRRNVAGLPTFCGKERWSIVRPKPVIEP